VVRARRAPLRARGGRGLGRRVPAHAARDRARPGERAACCGSTRAACSPAARRNRT
jgi:hypothetical protein